MKYHVNIYNQIVEKYTIKQIFTDNWDKFTQAMATEGRTIRKVIMEEVNKIIGCQDPKNGFALYSCTKCRKIKLVFFTCKSRFCNCCGAKYSNDRALNISQKLLDCSHRHVVFTIPEELRKYFALDRSLLDILFNAAADTIIFYFSKRSKSENYTPGMISALHTFGRDLKWNPHIHMILSEEAVGDSGKWIRLSHLDYKALRRSWQFSLLKLLSEKIHDPKFKLLVNELYATYKDGFYVNAPPVKNFNSGVINYIVRYVGRPVLAQSRITHYDGNYVTFNYTPHGSDKLVEEKIPVFEFIKRLIIHIPEKNFKMIRYFGYYYNFNSKYKQYLHRVKGNTAATIYTKLKAKNKTWRSRIMQYFRYDPLKCTCGAYYEFIELFCDPRKIKSYLKYWGFNSS